MLLEILTGRAKFLNDIKLPDMLYGKVLRSPHPHALIKKINKAKAESWEAFAPSLPGKMSLTGREARPVQARARSKGQVRGRCSGLVAATSEEIADEALRLIDVQYEVLRMFSTWKRP